MKRYTMNLRNITTVVLALVLGNQYLSAQNEMDALRYSSTTAYGTARALGMGGAFSAVGADFSAASLNPAGLALYRRSDFMVTPALRLNNNTATYLGETDTDLRAKFGFSNVGFVNANPVSKWNRATRSREEATSGLKSYAFSIGVTQLNNFARDISATAFNRESSITDYYAGQAQGYPYDDAFNQNSYVGLAIAAGLIDTSVVDGNYVGGMQNGFVDQELRIRETGRNNEWSFGFAGNFNDFIYAGLNLGIQSIRYEQDFYFEETDSRNIHQTWANDSTPLASHSLSDYYTTSGSGLNLRLGIIIRPSDFLRMGFSFTTPTWMSLTDQYSVDITSYFDNDPQAYGTQPLEGIYSYSLNTPMRMTAGVMAMLKKRGFVTADFEYLDYSGAKLSSDVPASSPYYYDFYEENLSIAQLFDAAYNLRLGAELRFGIARLRAGYAHYGATLKDEFLNYFDYDSGDIAKMIGGRQLFTGGFGFKSQSAYIDVALVRDVRHDRRLLYTLPDPSSYSPELLNKTASTNLYMTIGFTF